MQKRVPWDLGSRLKAWRLSIIFLFALQEMLHKMCSWPSLCEPFGGRWEKVWGKKRDKYESFLGLFGMDLHLSESLETAWSISECPLLMCVPI